MSTKSSYSLPWFKALKFSLRMMRKSFFKLFIPSMALSFLFGALNALIAINAWFYFTHSLLPFPFIVLFICAISLPIYAHLYPLLKRHVLFLGLQELSPFVFNEHKQLPRKIRLGNFLQLVKISLKRYLFQSLSFLLLILLPFINIYDLFLGYHQDIDIVGSMIMVLFVSIIALWPLAWSYFKYFFAELLALDEIAQGLRSDSNQSISSNQPNKKLFWSILSWKALMFVLYIALLFVLGQLYILSGKALNFGNYHSGFDLPMLHEVSPLLLFGFLFQPFFEPVLNAILKLRPNQEWFFWSYNRGSDIFLENPNALWILIFFLLLFGLLTAFFFLVETLSSVYFYRSTHED